MNEHSKLKTAGSLVERAAAAFDLGSAIRPPALPERVRPRSRAATVPATPPPLPAALAEAPAAPRKRRGRRAAAKDNMMVEAVAAAPAPAMTQVEIAPAAPARAGAGLELLPSGRYGEVDRDGLREAGFIVPDATATGLAEEFRIIKRQLLLGVCSDTIVDADKRQTILVCSARSDEGKTFSAVNLALSLASEKDREVLLVDGDFVKPEILSILGLEAGPGLIDAIADPTINAENYVIQTDIEGLAVLPAGRRENEVTELLASERTREVLAGLVRRRPRRIVIFDSPPALMASPASVLATHVGQVMMVVRADQTTEADLRDAIALLSGCSHVSLVLNGAGAAATGRRFGSYYGYGE